MTVQPRPTERLLTREPAPAAGLTVRGLRKVFARDGSPAVIALDGVDLDIAAGESVIMVGHNGSGKTTLLSLLFGDIAPDGGHMAIVREGVNEDFTTLPRRQRARFMARVHQDPALGTVSSLTLWENLRLADPQQSGPSLVRFGSVARARDAYAPILEPLGLEDKLDARASELSAGQRQLAALLIALLRRPLLLLLDEHTALLDARNARLCMQKAFELSRSTGTTVLAVTHDLSEALEYGDRLVVLRDGRVQHQLTADDKAGLGLESLFELCGYNPGGSRQTQHSGSDAYSATS